ncbi:protein FAR1-RELATED SEQUENCE 5-like [Asparagus officinalis]|uniref:protein FAR1-RELATED SEQUENCE 5-like n=1 Tax=Asparagus officinalis TaxID=4686 RepID=UPI00098E595C|nr:protein FAR1-RELATED SEQUENCE 5-like [Asparagus officinalis]
MNVETDDVLPIGLSENDTQNLMDVDGELHTALVSPNEMTFIGEAPYEGKEFATLEEAYNYYNSYAKKMGFGIRKETGDKSRKLGEIISQVFVCNKAGRKRLSDKRECGKLVNRRPDTRVDCPARMKIKLTSSKTWIITKFEGEHLTHLLSSPDKVWNHYSHRQRHHSKTCKRIIQNLSEEGMAPSILLECIMLCLRVFMTNILLHNNVLITSELLGRTTLVMNAYPS